jgi:hypothetical protein
LRKRSVTRCTHRCAPLRKQAGYIQHSACDERGATARGAAGHGHLLALVARTDVGRWLALARLLARTLLRSRAMATVDVSRIVALANKAETLTSRGHWARAAEVYTEAVTTAQALQQPDCIIVAELQASRADALLAHANTTGVPAARRVELTRCAFLELLPPAMASLERRMAAGTLLAGACRPYEMAWRAAKTAHGDALVASMPHAAARAPPTAAQMSASSAYVGYDTYMRTASIGLELCAHATDLSAARVLNLTEEEAAVACSVFVERAVDMIQLRTGVASMPEAVLVRTAQDIIDCFCATSAGNEWHARILAAWRRLQSSGVLQRRGLLQRMSVVTAYNMHQRATAAAAAAARGLHFCALHACGAQEVHASQFKRCSACLSVVYCCKEHQVQDWPAHKAACRAARKAAEADEASGA